MTVSDYILLLILLAAIERGYLLIARRAGIIDKPNERSSHTEQTIVRGGGILFLVAAMLAWGYYKANVPYFLLGLGLLAAISFFDDLVSVPNRYRIGIQFVAIGLLLYQTNVVPDRVWPTLLVVIIGVGILNAYNFMDGINGITAFYSLVTVGSIWYGLRQLVSASFLTEALLPFTVVALVVFSYFNARRQAICFAGDVGSMTLAFIVLFALVQFMQAVQTGLPILFLAVYGVDSVLTILHRMLLKQNIFRAHRLHLFQQLVHRLRWPHLSVSALYALVQLLINGCVLNALDWFWPNQLLLAATILGLLGITYLFSTIKLRD
ncbi:hypothetical protein WBJ53_05595 [Spirosoma sp. SC4-14]|uniref:hypothetical protein n=1 Tax=Spirosoma sp. SC4-14 TaxID=3128900 RepID=UPI0030CA846D